VTVTESSDQCSTPLVVPTAGPFPWSVTLDSDVATTQALDPGTGGSCYPFHLQRSMWLSFTPAVTDSYTFSLCASRVAGFIAAYSGPACGPRLPLNMCVANTELTGKCSEDPASSLALTAGTEYRFLVGSYYTNSFGPIAVSIHRGTVAPAVIRSVAPATGPTAGGTTVTLTGSGFAPGATVTFAGVAATGVTVLNPAVLTAIIPAHAAGNVDVSVHTGTTTTTSASAFTYAELPPGAGRRRSARH
jgi:hypothetical protein